MSVTRDETLRKLAAVEFDLLVIGGGATGCGIALDAASRGLKTALVERYDFAEGTSGRSTKLIHGGVRYLEKAVRNFDRAQYELVREGLAERRILLATAPHLVHPLPIVTPIYKTLDVPYVWAGLKLYDALAGQGSLSRSRLLSARDAVDAFPAMSRDNLKAGVLYADGQFNDARMIVALIQTATEFGAVCANRLELRGFGKTGRKIGEAYLSDNYGGGETIVRAKAFVNASGPFCEPVRRLAAPDAEPIITCSTGVHIALDKSFSPGPTALLIPKTEDGRVLFVIPWEGGVIAGTTDNPAEPDPHPKVGEEEIAYVLRHLACHLEKPPTRGDVRSVWSGVRPLLLGKATKTEQLVREHRIEVAESGLMTVVGGKWTSFRRMAKDAVDTAVARFDLSPSANCATDRIVLCGSRGSANQWADRLRELDGGLKTRLVRSYGDRARELAALDGFGEKLIPESDYLKTEVEWAVREEWALKPADFLCRRTPVALLDKNAAVALADAVSLTMAGELGWNAERAREEAEDFRNLLNTAI